MTSILRPLIPLLLLGPAMALLSGSAHAATPVRTDAPAMVQPAAAPQAKDARAETVAVPRLFSVQIRCARTGNRMVC